MTGERRRAGTPPTRGPRGGRPDDAARDGRDGRDDAARDGRDGPDDNGRDDAADVVRRTRRLLLVASALLVLGAAACWVASGRLLTPERHRATLPPDLPAEARPRELELVTADGLRLAAWVHEPPGAHGTVLLFHGKDGCRRWSRLAFLAARGFRGVAVDARAHGDSEGRWTTFGQDERLDVAAAWEHAAARWPDELIVGWGTSLGAAALLAFVDDHAALVGAPRRPLFDGLVLESLYTDVETAFRRRVVRRAGAWALLPARPVRWLVALRAGLDPADLRPRDLLAHAVAAGGPLEDVPLLIATGAEDPYVPPEDARALAAATRPGQATTVVVPGRGHADLLARDGSGAGAVHAAAVDAFLSRVRE